MTLHTLTLPARLVVGDESQDIGLTVRGDYSRGFSDEGGPEFQIHGAWLDTADGFHVPLPFKLSPDLSQAIGEKAMEMIQEGQG